MKQMLLAVLAVLLLAGNAVAGKDLELLSTLADDTFSDLIKEAGAATAYRATAPAEPGGITGFDIGVAVSVVDIRENNWDEALGGDDPPSYLAIPRVQLRKGLPFNIDIGAMYAYVPDSNLKLLGGEIQWAPLEGTAATPALAVRAHYSTLQGVSDVDLQTYGADVSISKGFLMLTPYAGAGLVRIKGKYTGNDPALNATLDDHEFTKPRYFGGVQMSLALLRLTLEAEYLERPVYTAKLSLGW